MYQLLRKALFRLNAEQAHELSTSLAKNTFNLPVVEGFLEKAFCYKNNLLHRNYLGIDFPNPLGLAAGFDKNAELVDSFSLLGFGFIEVGTVTPLAQSGNPKPRMFRLPAEKAIINRLGFNNKGMLEVARNLEKRKSKIIVGGNIGKNKLTPNEDAFSDYKKCFITLADLVDYFTVNVSSPNTPNLRELQDKEPLKKILLTVINENEKRKKPKPILLKVAPDLSEGQMNDIVSLVNELKLDGLIATNTSIRRDLIPESSTSQQAGGLSGKPLFEFSTNQLANFRSKLNDETVLVGVGGIMNEEDAALKLQSGANLIQVYTGFIYAGPSMPSKINWHLANNLKGKF